MSHSLDKCLDKRKNGRPLRQQSCCYASSRRIGERHAVITLIKRVAMFVFVFQGTVCGVIPESQLSSHPQHTHPHTTLTDRSIKGEKNIFKLRIISTVMWLILPVLGFACYTCVFIGFSLGSLHPTSQKHASRWIGCQWC